MFVKVWSDYFKVAAYEMIRNILWQQYSCTYKQIEINPASKSQQLSEVESRLRTFRLNTVIQLR